MDGHRFDWRILSLGMNARSRCLQEVTLTWVHGIVGGKLFSNVAKASLCCIGIRTTKRPVYWGARGKRGDAE